MTDLTHSSLTAVDRSSRFSSTVRGAFEEFRTDLVDPTVWLALASATVMVRLIAGLF